MTINKEPKGSSKASAINIVTTDGEKLFNSAKKLSTYDAKEDSLGNPGTDGYVLSSTTSGTRSWVSRNGTVTTVATTSGTGAKDLSTTIPAWATEITISFFNFSTNGTVMPVIQVGDGTYVTTGYLGSARRISGTAALHSTGFRLGNTWDAAYVVHGIIKLTLHNSTTHVWACSGSIARSGTAMNWVLAGSIDLTSALDRARITIGANTYDGGSVAIRYS